MTDLHTSELVVQVPEQQTMWEENILAGSTPNGGALLIVLTHRSTGTTVITEYDEQGFVIYRFEWQRDDPDALSDGHVATLEITDWDGAVVERRLAHRVPASELEYRRLGVHLAAAD